MHKIHVLYLYSSWETSGEYQSSPLWLFVESIATDHCDHQEASSFFHGKKRRRRIQPRDLEPGIVSPDHPTRCVKININV